MQVNVGLHNFMVKLAYVDVKKDCITASDKVYQLLAHGQWFSPGTPASSTTTTGGNDIAEKSINQSD
jgi:hypothetical protein